MLFSPHRLSDTGRPCREKDSNLRRRLPADLQSASFGRSDIPASRYRTSETHGAGGEILAMRRDSAYSEPCGPGAFPPPGAKHIGAGVPKGWSGQLAEPGAFPPRDRSDTFPPPGAERHWGMWHEVPEGPRPTGRGGGVRRDGGGNYRIPLAISVSLRTRSSIGGWVLNSLLTRRPRTALSGLSMKS